jgi:hypothetical protein
MIQNKNQGQQRDARQQNQADSKPKDKNQQELHQEDEPRDTSKKGDKNTLGRKDTPQGRK